MNKQQHTPGPWRKQYRLGMPEYYRGRAVIGRRFPQRFKPGGGVSATMIWILEYNGLRQGTFKTLADAKRIADAKELS